MTYVVSKSHKVVRQITLSIFVIFLVYILLKDGRDK